MRSADPRRRRLRHRAAAVATIVAAGAALALAGPPAFPGTGTAAVADHEAAEELVDRYLVDEEIVESSGLARSTYPRRVLWTHNDSGDSARVFAVGRDGETRAVLTLAGASAADWEDIAAGPHHTLWVADVGDNGWDRDRVTVYRFEEPKKLESGTVAAERFDLVYPGGPRDAEAILVRPATGRLFVVSKDESGGHMYRAPRELSTSKVNRLRRVGRAPATVTAASWAPGGRGFVLVTYTRIFVHAKVGEDPVSVTAKVNNSDQGESAEVSRNGAWLFLGQEGTRSPVYRVPYDAP